jgi:hypothetical protein
VGDSGESGRREGFSINDTNSLSQNL